MRNTRVLGAMLRLARRREAATEDELALRVRGAKSQIRASIRELASAGLVELRPGRPARLTMEGFARAVALLPGNRSHSGPRILRAPRAA
jgi:Mn-dependent DtxR family transcriptional regulator